MHRPATADRPPLGRTFWTVWGGQTVSTVGSALAAIGVAVHVYATTGSVAWLGVLLALAALPSVLVAPLLGLVDRVDRRRMMIAADLFAASGPALALALAWLGELRVEHLVVAGFVAGIGNALQFPAYQAALPDLVPRDAIGRANGVVQLSPALAVVAGPAAASGLLVLGGIEAVLMADLVSCAAGVGATAAARFRSRPDRAARTGQGADGGAGLGAWVWLRGPGRPLLGLLVMMAGVNLGLACFNVAVLALATDLGGPGRAGWAPAVGGVGMVVTSLVLARTGVPARRLRTATMAIGVVGVGVGVTGLRPSFALVVLGVAIAMAAVPLANASVSTMFHEHVPAALHGRVFGLRAALGRGLEPLGSIASGVLVASVTGPLVASPGWPGRAARWVVGHGDGRAAALLVVLVALGLLVLARHTMRRPGLALLDRSAAPVASARPAEAEELVEGARA